MNIITTTSIIALSFIISACGGGSASTPVDRTVSLKLSSASEGGNANFAALLLQPIVGGGLSQTGIVLLHGRGGNPDSAVVRQLREDLYDRGYTTLSLFKKRFHRDL